MGDRPPDLREPLARRRWVAGACAVGTVAVSLAILGARSLRAGWVLRPAPSSLLEDGYLLGLVFAVGAFAPALAASGETRTVWARRATAAVLAVATGALFGLAKATDAVLQSRYLPLGMTRLAVINSAEIVASLCLAALGILVPAIALAAVLPAIARSERVRRVLFGLLPAAAVFALGVAPLNHAIPGGPFEPVGLAANALWAAVCVSAVWPLGWLSQRLGALAMRLPITVVAGAAALPVTVLGIANIALPAPAANRPSVVLISIDTLRADHLSAYGYPRNTSPNLDRLAADGVLFRNAVAQAPWTLPSQMSILTALYPSTHGVLTQGSKLAQRFVTLGEILQEEGYTTLAVTDGVYLGPGYGHQGFDRLAFRRGPLGVVRLASAIVDKAVAFLRRRRGPEPFFLFVHTYQVHCPYDPPPEWDRFTDPRSASELDLTGKCELEFQAIKSSMSPADFERVIGKYDGEIAYTDDELGRLFAELKAQGLYDTSVIVVTADHGENFSEHPQYKLGHGDSLFASTQHVPLILKAPGLPPGTTVDALVETVDILPTVLDLLAIRLPEPVDGTTLRPTIVSGTGERGWAHSEAPFRRRPEDASRRATLRSIRSERWKMICSAQNECELYDLVADPREQENLVAVRPEVARELRSRLARWAAEQDRRLEAVDAEAAKIDGALMDQMRALGYVQ